MTNALNLGDVTLPGETYPSLFGFSIPVTSGLEGAYLFGEGASQMPFNYAVDKPDATVIGAPGAGSGFATFSENGYLDTGIAETAEMTIITVCRDNTGTGDPVPAFVGNHLNTTLGGVAIFHNNTGLQAQAQAVKANASDVAAVALANGYTWAMLAHRPKNAAPSLMANLTTGASGSSPSSGARTVYAAPIWIGRIPNNSYKGLNDQVACLIYSRALSDVELNQVSAWLRSYCASKSIVA